MDDPFTINWDAAVIGGGIAGLAAATLLAGSGQRILLIERRAALAWECGWSNWQDMGETDAPGWSDWCKRLTAAGGMEGGVPDAAQSEIQAHALVRDLGIGLLFYAGPVDVVCVDGLLAAVVMGTKSGLRHVIAKRWIDASDTGELCAVLQHGWQAPQPSSQHLTIAWRRMDWQSADRSGHLHGEPGATWTWRRSGWRDERILSIDLPYSTRRTRRSWIPAMTALRAEAGTELEDAVVSHGSVCPYPVYPEGQIPLGLPGNLATAIPGRCGRALRTLADRWALGAEARTILGGMPQSTASVPTAAWAWPDVPLMRTDILVAGLGTGGSLAAIAAGRQGAAVIGAEPLPFYGGIGSGGGIHLYYFGVRGGLQEEVDTRVRKILPSFGSTAQICCFHPDAKKTVLDEMLDEAGVSILPESTLVAVHCSGRRIVEALFSTPCGPVRINAGSWIDGTGDGDMAAAAGCAFRYGRSGDGRLHAYSQSIACTRMDGEKPYVAVTNFDSGFVDASDPADLTRARHAGVLQHLTAQIDRVARPAQVCPAIGLRQDRHIACSAEITLDDLVYRRRFADSIALVGGHYDNHAADYEHESDSAMLWVWGCGGWNARIACEVPYGAIVPRDIDNCWIASRCLGVSEEAHHCVRMQRDMQRIGEAAGIAAALAHGCDSRSVDLVRLRSQLVASGALQPATDLPDNDPLTGISGIASAECTEDTSEKSAAEALKDGVPSDLWRLARTGGSTEDLHRALTDPDQTISFRAALILAWRRDQSARLRLLMSIRMRECGQPHQPRHDQVPRWFAALAFLRFVPHRDVIAVLAGLADDPIIPFRARVATALALEALLKHDREVHAGIPAILSRLLAFPAPDATGVPRRHLQQQPIDGGNGHAVAEDDSWQIHLVAARIRRRLGLPPSRQSLGYRDDPRAGVRRAFATAFPEMHSGDRRIPA